MRAAGVALMVIAVAVALAMGGGCAGELDRPERFYDGGACDPEAVLRQRCATSGCHAATNPESGLDLASRGVGARLRNRAGSGCAGMLIDVAAPEASLLLDKISDRPSCGYQMPPGQPLGETERACLTAWVNAVAAGGAE
jgi:hypothetical protein